MHRRNSTRIEQQPPHGIRCSQESTIAEGKVLDSFNAHLRADCWYKGGKSIEFVLKGRRQLTRNNSDPLRFHSRAIFRKYNNLLDWFIPTSCKVLNVNCVVIHWELECQVWNVSVNFKSVLSLRKLKLWIYESGIEFKTVLVIANTGIILKMVI